MPKYLRQRDPTWYGSHPQLTRNQRHGFVEEFRDGYISSDNWMCYEYQWGDPASHGCVPEYVDCEKDHVVLWDGTDLGLKHVACLYGHGDIPAHRTSGSSSSSSGKTKSVMQPSNVTVGTAGAAITSSKSAQASVNETSAAPTSTKQSGSDEQQHSPQSGTENAPPSPVLGTAPRRRAVPGVRMVGPFALEHLCGPKHPFARAVTLPPLVGGLGSGGAVALRDAPPTRVGACLVSSDRLGSGVYEVDVKIHSPWGPDGQQLPAGTPPSGACFAVWLYARERHYPKVMQVQPTVSHRDHNNNSKNNISNIGAAAAGSPSSSPSKKTTAGGPLNDLGEMPHSLRQLFWVPPGQDLQFGSTGSPSTSVSSMRSVNMQGSMSIEMSRRPNIVQCEIDAPIIGKHGDFTTARFSTSTDPNEQTYLKVRTPGNLMDGKYHRFSFRWETEAVPVPSIADHQVRKFNGHFRLVDSSHPAYPSCQRLPLFRDPRTGIWHLKTGKKCSFFIDNILVGASIKHVGCIAGRLVIGLWFPDYAGKAKWSWCKVSVARITHQPSNSPGDTYFQNSMNEVFAPVLVPPYPVKQMPTLSRLRRDQQRGFSDDFRDGLLSERWCSRSMPEYGIAPELLDMSSDNVVFWDGTDKGRNVPVVQLFAHGDLVTPVVEDPGLNDRRIPPTLAGSFVRPPVPGWSNGDVRRTGSVLTTRHPFASGMYQIDFKISHPMVGRHVIDGPPRGVQFCIWLTHVEEHFAVRNRPARPSTAVTVTAGVGSASSPVETILVDDPQFVSSSAVDVLHVPSGSSSSKLGSSSGLSSSMTDLLCSCFCPYVVIVLGKSLPPQQVHIPSSASAHSSNESDAALAPVPDTADMIMRHGFVESFSGDPGAMKGRCGFSAPYSLIDGKYHSLRFQWETALEPVLEQQESIDSLVTWSNGYFRLRDARLYPHLAGVALMKHRNGRWHRMAGKRLSVFIDNILVANLEESIPSVACRLNIGLLMDPNKYSSAPFEWAKIQLAGVRASPYLNDGDVWFQSESFPELGIVPVPRIYHCDTPSASVVVNQLLLKSPVSAKIAASTAGRLGDINSAVVPPRPVSELSTSSDEEDSDSQATSDPNAPAGKGRRNRAEGFAASLQDVQFGLPRPLKGGFVSTFDRGIDGDLFSLVEDMIQDGGGGVVPEYCVIEKDLVDSDGRCQYQNVLSLYCHGDVFSKNECVSFPGVPGQGCSLSTALCPIPLHSSSGRDLRKDESAIAITGNTHELDAIATSAPPLVSGCRVFPHYSKHASQTPTVRKTIVRSGHPGRVGSCIVTKDELTSGTIELDLKVTHPTVGAAVLDSISPVGTALFVKLFRSDVHFADPLDKRGLSINPDDLQYRSVAKQLVQSYRATKATPKAAATTSPAPSTGTPPPVSDVYHPNPGTVRGASSAAVGGAFGTAASGSAFTSSPDSGTSPFPSPVIPSHFTSGPSGSWWYSVSSNEVCWPSITFQTPSHASSSSSVNPLLVPSAAARGGSSGAFDTVPSGLVDLHQQQSPSAGHHRPFAAVPHHSTVGRTGGHGAELPRAEFRSTVSVSEESRHFIDPTPLLDGRYHRLKLEWSTELVDVTHLGIRDSDVLFQNGYYRIASSSPQFHDLTGEPLSKFAGKWYLHRGKELSLFIDGKYICRICENVSASSARLMIGIHCTTESGQASWEWAKISVARISYQPHCDPADLVFQGPSFPFRTVPPSVVYRDRLWRELIVPLSASRGDESKQQASSRPHVPMVPPSTSGAVAESVVDRNRLRHSLTATPPKMPHHLHAETAAVLPVYPRPDPVELRFQQQVVETTTGVIGDRATSLPYSSGAATAASSPRHATRSVERSGTGSITVNDNDAADHIHQLIPEPGQTSNSVVQADDPMLLMMMDKGFGRGLMAHAAAAANPVTTAQPYGGITSGHNDQEHTLLWPADHQDRPPSHQ